MSEEEGESSRGFLFPQGKNGVLAARLPEGRVKEVVARTSGCFWLCAVLVVLALIIGMVALGAVAGLSVALIVPVLFLSMRYLWWRMVWDPFGSWSSAEDSSDKQTYMTFLTATRQICCPDKCNYKRVCCHSHTPLYLIATTVFWVIFILSLLGILLLSTAHESVDPPLFIVICWNTGGAIVLLIVSVWIVDVAVLIMTWLCAALTIICCRDNHESDTSEKGSDSRNSSFHPVNVKEDAPVETSSSLTTGAGTDDEVVLGSGNIEEGRVLSNDQNAMEGTTVVVAGGSMIMEDRTDKVILGNDHENTVSLNESQNNNNDLKVAPDARNLAHNISSNRTGSKSFVKRIMTLCSLLVFIILIVVSSIDSYSDPRSITLSIPVRQLPTCLDGFKLALLTDVHAGSLSGDNEMRRIVELVEAWKPDAVAISGDLGDQEVNNALKKKVNPLASFQSVPDGVYWTPGNHENDAGIQDYRDLFSPSGNNNTSPLSFIKTLENSYHSVTFSRHNDVNCSFDIAGLADASGDETLLSGQIKPDINETLHGRDPSDALVLLNHQPVHFDKYAKAGAGLILAGHTHGGQIWPIHPLLWFVYGQRISGLFTESSLITNVPPSSGTYPPAYLYVSEGTVGWGPRVRLLSYPEITYITLRNPDKFSAEGGSTADDEALRAAVYGLYFGLFLIPLSIVICILRAFGSCWRHEVDAIAIKGWMQTCGGNVQPVGVHEV